MAHHTQVQVEHWKPVPGWEKLYEVSSLGRVRSLPRLITNSLGVEHRVRGRIRRQSSNGHGYQTVSLCAGGKEYRKYVHRLVLEAFVGDCPEGMETRHLNGNRKDNRLENLQWGTVVENHHDKLQHGTDHYASRDKCSRGHLYTPENTRWYEYPNKLTISGEKVRTRVCRTCERMKKKPKPRKVKEPRTHCKWGHDITGDNGRLKMKKFRRKDGSTGETWTVECRKCAAEHSKRAEEKRKARRRAASGKVCKPV